ncbi:MAG: NUDIX domain-containing protein [Candidatus Zambryskibacteria bacterium]|nr:NUDIX domain-containing protein [Candidatus Zambryskibacteria bacterium]
MHKNYLTDEEFYTIYGRVPRLNVDLIIRSNEGVLFSQRAIEPIKGFWHLPGGTVYKTEKIEEAAVRIAKKETNLDVKVLGCLGYMEFLSEMRNGVEIHSISIVMEVEAVRGEAKPDEHATAVKYFMVLPEPVSKEHGVFLTEKGIFK